MRDLMANYDPGWTTRPRKGWVDLGDGIAVQREAITSGPYLNRGHIDGPLLMWAGSLHWLTLWERLRLWLGLTTVDALATCRWPHLALLRSIQMQDNEQ